MLSTRRDLCIKSVLRKQLRQDYGRKCACLIEICSAKVCTCLTRGMRAVPLNIQISDMNEMGYFSTSEIQVMQKSS